VTRICLLADGSCSPVLERGQMTATVSCPADQPGRCGRLRRLPAGGRGNGLDDQARALAPELTGTAVPAVLGGLGEAGVPAYAARGLAARGGRWARGRQAGACWLRAGASAYGRAGTALMRLMPALSRQADAVWR
jgi:hypothetical protein